MSKSLGEKLYSHRPIPKYSKERTEVAFDGRVLLLCHVALALVVGVDPDRLSNIRNRYSCGPILEPTPFVRSTKGAEAAARKTSHGKLLRQFIVSWGPSFGLCEGDGFEGFTFLIYNVVDPRKIYEEHFIPWLRRFYEEQCIPFLEQVFPTLSRVRIRMDLGARSALEDHRQGHTQSVRFVLLVVRPDIGIDASFCGVPPSQKRVG